MNYRGLDIPFTSFGNVTSDDLFADKEQKIFDFYSSKPYARALDIGANIGVHSILMARQGWAVRAFEPDPEHFKRLIVNVERHGAMVDLNNAAVSNFGGETEFVRVLGNTTGSHIAGMKNPYGELERFPVRVVDARTILPWADFAKIDAEGAEADIIECLLPDGPDLMVEVGTEANAVRILDHLRKIGRKSWAQKSGWGEVKYLADMPTHHSHGALFIGEGKP